MGRSFCRPWNCQPESHRVLVKLLRHRRGKDSLLLASNPILATRHLKGRSNRMASHPQVNNSTNSNSELWDQGNNLMDNNNLVGVV